MNDSPRPRLAVMDTTLRDGEQTPDVSFSPDEKLAITRALLEEAGVDRVEVCSARVSPGEQRAARAIADWARSSGLLERVEALGYADGERSARWLAEAGLTRMNLLVKGSERHCTEQLRLSPLEHQAQAQRTLAAARNAGVGVSGVYLEDWSRGVVERPSYVLDLVRALAQAGVQRFYLCDTLGVMSPRSVTEQVTFMRRALPALAFEFHAHDDYGLATANCLAAAEAGVDGLHTAVNGLGERAGNASLAEIVVVLRDHALRDTVVNEAALMALSRRVAEASGYAVAHNAPVAGAHVFTQTAGIHADGDAKGMLYASRLAPERFGRRREYALGKLAGRASLAYHLGACGLSAAPELEQALLAQVVALGDEKRAVRREDLLRLLARLQPDSGRTE